MNFANFKMNFKKNKDKLIHPLIVVLDKIGFTADRATLLSVIFGLAAVYFLFKNHTLFIGLIFGHFLFDLLDGSLARYQKKPADAKGIWFDYLADRIVVLSMLLKVSILQVYFFWALMLYLIMQLLLILFFLRKKATNIKKIIFLEGFIIGSFIINVPKLIIPVIIFSFLVNFFLWLRKTN